MASYATRKRGARQAAAAGRQLDRDIAAAKAEREAQRAAYTKAYDEARKAEQPVAAEVIDALRPGDFVRDRYGWHLVTQVNRKSVFVAGDFGREAIGFDRILDVRRVA